MLIMMPLLTGQTISDTVMGGICSQSLPFDLRANWMDAINRKANREVNINSNRHALQGFLDSAYPNSHVVLMDSDVVMVYPHTLRKMRDYLDSNLDVGCVAIPTKPEYDNSHIGCALALIRASEYKKLDYMNNPKECQCLKVMRQCKTEYLIGISAHEISRI
jgi:hypothetical protein